MSSRESVAVLVAHPDDETLWAGGTLLGARDWAPFVVALCRASDADRAPRFVRALAALSAEGAIADLDDGPEQDPLPDEQVEQAVLQALPTTQFDRILTHSPLGEYTRHRRHEEVARAVLRLWLSERLSATEVWLFAYDDERGKRLPSALATADVVRDLALDVWQAKLRVLTDCYGFLPTTWEARVTPRREAFFRLRTRAEARAWLGRTRNE